MKLKRIFALILCLCMVMSTISFTAFADETDAGNIQVAYVTANFNNGGKSGIYGEAIGVVGTESFKVELYSGETLVGTSELVDTDKVLLNGASQTISWHILLGEDTDSWWNTNWVDGAMKVDKFPDKVKLLVDGTLVSEGDVKLNSSDDSCPIVAVVADENGNAQSFVAGTGYLNGVGDNAPAYDEALKSAVSTANNGKTIALLRDIAISKTVQVNFEGAITIDGNGHRITNNGATNAAVVLGNSGYNDTHKASHEVTLKNVVFDGWTTEHVVRVQGATVTIDGCEFINCNQTSGLGLLTLTFADATVTDCVFKDNKCVEVIDVNSWGDNSGASVTIENCSFENNEASGLYDLTGIIAAFYGDVSIENNDFVGNTAEINIVYTETNADVNGNYFSGNTLTSTDEKKAVVMAGPWHDGNYTVNITENAFTDEYKGAYVEQFENYPDAVTAYNLDRNYWNGGEPNYGTTGEPTVELNDYYTAVNEDGSIDTDSLVAVEKAGLSGLGTAEDPYLINNLEDLKWFRDDVNTYTSDGSNQYKGKYVKLNANIDLKGENWTPIGDNTTNDHEAFLGTFDGGGHTISNLYINADGDHLGFFARVGSYGEDVTPTVKNITFENVDVSSNTTTGHGGSYVGGVIANAGGNSVVSNVKVTGDVYVVGYGYVGGIVGHGYPDIDSCSVDATDGSYINAHYWCVGGIIGYAGEGGTPITNCSVEGVDIWSAYGGAAAVAGLLQDGNKVENVSASNVSITSASDYCMGYIAGNGEASTMTDIAVTNVTAAANGVAITPTDVIAQINDAIYFNLADAVTAAQNGETVKLVNNATGEVTIEKDITLDLNGKTLNGAILDGSKGNITVKNGTIKNANSAKSAIEINAGILVVEDVNIESERHAIRIDGDVDATINGGTYKVLVNNELTSHAVNVSGAATVTINGGTFYGPKGTPNGSAMGGSAVNVQTGAAVTINGGTFSGGVSDTLASAGTLIVYGGTYDQNPEAYVAEGYEAVANEDSTYTVQKAVEPVAQIGDVTYKTLADALAAAADGETITLLADVELAESLVLNTEGTITIDGNGHKITTADDFKDTQVAAIMLGATTWGDAEAATHNYTFKNVVFDGVNATSVIRAQGVTLTFDGCEVKNTSGSRDAVLRLDYTESIIKNSKFDSNVGGGMVVLHNYNVGDEGSNTKLTIDNCEFSNNTVNLNSAVVYYVTGGGCTITNTEFVGNTITSAVNAATLYLGFQEDCKVTDCLFKDNAVSTTKDTTRVAGAIFFGYEAEITGNAFINNTASNTNGDVLGQDVCTSVYYGDIDLSGNYFDGSKPVEGVDYLIQHKDSDVETRGDFSLTNYYTSYTTDANGNIVMGDIVYLPNADITYGGYVNTKNYTDGKEPNYREYMCVDIYDVYAEESLVVKLYSGETLLSTTTMRSKDRDDNTAISLPKNATTTANIVIDGRLAGSWDTEWEVKLSADNLPDKIEVWVDGTLCDTWNQGFTNDDEKAEYVAFDGVYKAASVTDAEGVVDYYATLQAAVNAAEAGDTVIVLDDIALDSTVTISDGKTIALDLNGKTISAGEDFAAINGGILAVERGAELTINDSSEEGTGTVDSKDVYAAVLMTTSTDTNTDGTAKLTVDGGTLKGFYYAVTGNGSRNNTEIVVNGGKLMGTNDVVSLGIFHPQVGTVTINGGEVVGTVGIEMRSGTLNMTGGTVKSDYSGELTTINSDSGSTVYGGAAVVLSQHATNNPVEINITGGTLEGQYAFYQNRLIATDEPSVNISATIGADVRVEGKVEAAEEGFTMEGDAENGWTLEAVEEEPGLFENLLVVYNMNKTTRNGVEYYPIHIYAGIDSLKYKEVGFKIKATNNSNPDGVTDQKRSTVVYESMTVINSEGETTEYLPSQLGGNYMFGHELLFSTSSWANEDTNIWITPYALKLDGTEIEGKTTQLSDSIIKDKDSNSALFKEGN